MAHGNVAQRNKEQLELRRAAGFYLAFFSPRPPPPLPHLSLSSPKVSPRDQLIISVICMKIDRKGRAFFFLFSNRICVRFSMPMHSIQFSSSSIIPLYNCLRYDRESRFAISSRKIRSDNFLHREYKFRTF